MVRAVELFSGAAAEGYMPAVCELGLCYELGHGVEMDKGKAAELYQEGADQDYAPAQCNLGYFYYQGIYFEENNDEAAVLFAKAAQRLEEPELLELRKSLEARAAGRFPAPVQLRRRDAAAEAEDAEAFRI